MTKKGLFIFPFLVGFLGFFIVQAQTSQSQIILTWQANNFYPSDFLGKALATPNSSITVAVELLINQKLQDISSADITWRLDGNFLQEGVGLKETSFVVNKARGDSYLMNVTIQPSSGPPFEKSISIPVTNPKVIIENPYPNGLAAANSQIHFRAVPYFMNINSIQDLTFSWQVNGLAPVKSDDNQLVLNIGAPQTANQSSLQINVSAQNNKNPLDIFVNQILLLIQ